MPIAKLLLLLSLLVVATPAVAQQRQATDRQRFRVHVPQKVAFGSLPEVPSPANPLVAKADSTPQFVAETTAGVTILFEAIATDGRSLPLEVRLGDRHAGSWQVHADQPNLVQVSSRGAGWTSLHLQAPALADDAQPPTVVITVVTSF